MPSPLTLGLSPPVRAAPMAGGPGTPADVAAAVGTVLLRSDEAGTSAVHKAALADPARTTTVLTHVFTGHPARALRKAAAAAGDPERAYLWAGRLPARDGRTPADILTRLARQL